MKIEFISSADWGCEHTDEDREAYETAVLAALVVAYPGAYVEVRTANTDHSHAVIDGDFTRLGDEEREIEGIAQDVWDRAEFWPARSIGGAT